MELIQLRGWSTQEVEIARMAVSTNCDRSMVHGGSIFQSYRGISEINYLYLAAR